MGFLKGLKGLRKVVSTLISHLFLLHPIPIILGGIWAFWVKPWQVASFRPWEQVQRSSQKLSSKMGKGELGHASHLGSPEPPYLLSLPWVTSSITIIFKSMFYNCTGMKVGISHAGFIITYSSSLISQDFYRP